MLDVLNSQKSELFGAGEAPRDATITRTTASISNIINASYISGSGNQTVWTVADHPNLNLNEDGHTLTAWFFMGEPLQHYHFFGAGLILPGIFLVNLPDKKHDC